MGLYSNILRILDNPENMSQHGRRAYWAHQIVLMAREDAVQRVEAAWGSSWCGLRYATCDDPDHACRYRREVIAAIKGDSHG